MNNFKRLSFKLAAIAMLLVSNLFWFQKEKVIAKEIDSSSIKQNLKDESPFLTTVSTNMLDVNTCAVIGATIATIAGLDFRESKTNKITVTFSSLPKTDEKIMAVLTDRVVGGVIEAKFLDENNIVTFEDIPPAVLNVGIHLYKQSPTDPDFVLRKENFIASTAYVLPYFCCDKLEICQPARVFKKGGESLPTSVPFPTLYRYTNTSSLWGISIPMGFLPNIDVSEGEQAYDILAVIIPEYSDGKPVNPKNPNKQTVMKKYSLYSGNFILKEKYRIEFDLDDGIENVGVHLYKKSLQDSNLLCTFSLKNLPN